MKSKSYNLFRAGSAKYYKDQLENISMVAEVYDGYNPDDAKQMRELVDELANMARDALQHKDLYCKDF